MISRVSYEFFPPKNQTAIDNLKRTTQKLAQTKAEFFSVTYGAGGSTLQQTPETVAMVAELSNVPVTPHLSCMTTNTQEISQLLAQYQQQGINRIIALRGDMPSGLGIAQGELRYANELVSFIRETTGDYFHIEVACYPEYHPQAENAQADILYFKQKVEAGANRAITQYFFNADSYFRFLDECERQQIDVPIIPGIMPITNYTQLARFSKVCGAEIPRWLKKRLESFVDDKESLQAYGTEVISKLCQTLLDAGAPGLHFYTLNRANPTLAVLENLT